MQEFSPCVFDKKPEKPDLRFDIRASEWSPAKAARDKHLLHLEDSEERS